MGGWVPLRGCPVPVHLGYTGRGTLPVASSTPQRCCTRWYPRLAHVSVIGVQRDRSSAKSVICDRVVEQVDCRSVDSPPLDAVVEGSWKGIRVSDALARADSGPTRQPERGGWTQKCRCITLLILLGFVVRVPVGVTRPQLARASASPAVLPVHNPLHDGLSVSRGDGHLG